jgi:hypothetical protein
MKHIKVYESFESLDSSADKIIVVKIFFYSVEEGETKMIGISKGSTLQKTFDELIVALSEWIGVDEETPGDWKYEIPENSTPEKLENILRNWADTCGWYEYDDKDKIEVKIFECSSVAQRELDAINMVRRISYKPNIEISKEYAEAFNHPGKSTGEIEEIVDRLTPGEENEKIIDFISSY